MSKHCEPQCSHRGSQCGDQCGRQKLYRRISFWLLGFIILVLLVILIVWLVLRPTKPKFYLQDATVYSFNTSGGPPSLINANIQVTISSRNPNDRIGIYYDKLNVFAAYKYQQITPATIINGFYQGHNDIILWSPFLCAVNVPVAPYLSVPLGQELSTGLLQLNVKLDGRIRWKAGTWTSGHYHLFVNCPALLTFRSNWGGGADGSAGYEPVIRFDRVAGCSVDV